MRGFLWGSCYGGQGLFRSLMGPKLAQVGFVVHDALATSSSTTASSATHFVIHSCFIKLILVLFILSFLFLVFHPRFMRISLSKGGFGCGVPPTVPCSLCNDEIVAFCGHQAKPACLRSPPRSHLGCYAACFTQAASGLRAKQKWKRTCETALRCAPKKPKSRA